MVYRTSSPWDIEPPNYGILNPLRMVYLTPTHGISNHLTMVFRTSYPWYIKPPTHGILSPLPKEY
jgi:hypothetical protein